MLILCTLQIDSELAYATARLCLIGTCFFSSILFYFQSSSVCLRYCGVPYCWNRSLVSQVGISTLSKVRRRNQMDVNSFDKRVDFILIERLPRISETYQTILRGRRIVLDH